MHLAHCIPLFPVDLRSYIVGILNGIRVFFDPALPAVQIFFERLQVIGIHSGKHIRHHLDHADIAGLFLLLIPCGFIADHDGAEIKSGALDLKGIL